MLRHIVSEVCQQDVPNTEAQGFWEEREERRGQRREVMKEIGQWLEDRTPRVAPAVTYSKIVGVSAIC